jgi:hypothetical protein
LRVLHQCYMNLCLIFDLSLPSSHQVYPEPLGRSYAIMNYDKMQAQKEASADETVNLTVWGSPVLAYNQVQEIGVSVYQNSKPAVGVTPTLQLTLPDESVTTTIFPPTDSTGRATQSIGPFEGANGDRISYKVCLSLAGGKQNCAGDSFVIWNNP